MEKTKLIATVNITPRLEDQVYQFIKTGIDVIRLNMSYLNHEDCTKVIDIVNKVNSELGTNVAIMLDLEGPCPRTGEFINGMAYFNTGDKIRIYTDQIKGNMTGFSVNYPEIIKALKFHSHLKLSKGNVELEVIEKGLDYVLCEVLKGGEVYDHSKIYISEASVNRKFLTKGDIDDIVYAHKMNVDFLAISAINSSEDILEVNDLLIELENSNISLLAKIENRRAAEDLENIVKVSDGIILDRGDLGIDIPVETVPNIQKKIIEACYDANKMSIITAEFSSFLLKKSVPNRAEVSDLSNLVSEAIDAIMLTSETTVSLNPLSTVETIKKIIKASEESIDYNDFFKKSLDKDKKTIAGTISSSVVLGVNELGCKAVVVTTNRGRTAKIISNLKPPCPIIAATSNKAVVKSLQLCFGVLPVVIDNYNIDNITAKVKEAVQDEIKLNPGDKIIVTGGYPFKKLKYTNFMKIEEL